MQYREDSLMGSFWACDALPSWLVFAFHGLLVLMECGKFIGTKQNITYRSMFLCRLVLSYCFLFINAGDYFNEAWAETGNGAITNTETCGKYTRGEQEYDIQKFNCSTPLDVYCMPYNGEFPPTRKMSINFFLAFHM